MQVMRTSCWTLIALAACCMSGCIEAPPKQSRWDNAQKKTTSATADQQQEKDDGRSGENYDRDISEVPPAWDPKGAPSRSPADQKTEWKVGDKPRASSTEPAKPPRPRINLDDLKSGDVLPGSEFNKFFPQQEGEWDLVYKQEKQGFALASLRRDGEELALLSITDLRSNPEAAEKYVDSTGEIKGYPTAEIGSKGLGMLVGSRFQVQVRSESDDFTARDRAEWIRRFDLEGLEGLK